MQVAFLGLGAMGAPMAARLSEQLPTRVWNRTTSVALTHAAEHGGTAMTDLGGLVDVDVICSCLPTDVEVAAVVEAVVPVLAPGTVWVDHTSGAPAGARDVARRLAEREVRYLDAPVSGGTDGAQAGALTVMVGGDADALARVGAVLDVVAERVVHVGEVGAGMAVKAVNNAVLAVSLWATTEGLSALATLGIDPGAALEVINGSSGRSFASERLLPERALTRAFPATFALSLLAKDVGLAGGVVAEAGFDAPVLGLVERLTADASAQLGAGADHVELVKLVEAAAGVELRAR